MIKQKFLQRAAIGLATTNPSKTSAEVIKAAMDLTNAAALLDQAGCTIAEFCDAPGWGYLYVLDPVQCRTGGGRAWTEHRLVRIASYDEAVAFIRARE